MVGEDDLSLTHLLFVVSRSGKIWQNEARLFYLYEQWPVDVNHLLTFKKVAETGGFTAAALALGLPKSSVSQKVSLLEKELGVRLLQRTTRRVSLTEIGERIYETACRIADDAETIEALVGSAREEPVGLLRVTAAHDLGVYLISRFCGAFRARYPKVELELDLSGRIVDLVREGFDVAIRATGGPLPESTLVARPLASTKMRIFASPSWVLKHGLPARPEDLDGAEVAWFAMRERRGPGTWKLRRDGREVEIPVTAGLRADDLLALKHAVVAGLGVAYLPELLYQAEVDRGEIVRVLPEWDLGQGVFHAVYPSRKYLPAKTRAFLDMLGESLSSEAPRP